MGMIDRVVMAFSPRRAADRERARLLTMHYRAAQLGRNNEGIRASGSDADLAGRDRRRIAFYARDLIRNTPMAARIQQVITGHVVGDGILPKIQCSRGLPGTVQKRLKLQGLEMIETHCDTVAIDRCGLQNLYGLQALAMNTIVDAGEVLIRRHRPAKAGLRIPLQLEVLDASWTSAAAVSFTTQVGVVIIPYVLIINTILLFLGLTKTMDIDIWNYWHFALSGSLMISRLRLPKP